jgi:hypothetical protein
MVARAPTVSAQDLAGGMMTPAMLPLQRRSQYLADAIEQINRSAQEGIRSPEALGTNLLAEAVDLYGQNRNDKRLVEAGRSERASMADMLMRGLPGSAPMSDASGIAPGMAAAPPAPSAPQAPQAPSGPTPPAAAPTAQPYANVPHQPVTPAEVARVQALLHSDNPALFQQGVELAQQLQTRMTTPAPLSPGYNYRPDGSVQNLQENYEPIPGATPADSAQRNTVTNHTEHQAIPGVQGPNGSFLQNGGYQTPPSMVGNNVLPFGSPSSDQAAGTINTMMQAPQVAQYYNLRTKAAATLSVSPQQGNAATDLQLIETLQEALNGNPQLAVREGLIHNITESPGLIAQMTGGAQNALSQGASGYLLPPMRERIQRVIRGALQERQQAAQEYVDRMHHAMQPLGYPDQMFPQIDQVPQQAQQQQPQRAPPRLPVGLNPGQAHQWALQHGLHTGDPVILPDGSPGRVP